VRQHVDEQLLVFTGAAVGAAIFAAAISDGFGKLAVHGKHNMS
jgi:hypothetical protein